MRRPPPPLLALGAAVAQQRLPGATARPGPWRGAASASLAVASVSLAGAAVGRFRRSGTTVEPFHPERASALVTTGVFAVTRNPMYVGMAGVLASHAVWRGSWAALLPLAGFVLLIDRTQIAAEEAALLETFGPELRTYRARTPRWLDHRSLISAGR